MIHQKFQWGIAARLAKDLAGSAAGPAGAATTVPGTKKP